MWKLFPTLLTVLFVVGSAARADDAANKADMAAFQGEWFMVSGERGGEAMPAVYAKTGKRVCKDDQVSVTIAGMLLMKATLSVDAGKSPKTIDYKITDGPNKGKLQLGIYELNGDTFKSCFSNPGEERPTAFETKAGDGRTMSVWKKASAP